MMLSRVAERFYWMARYLERTENTARIVNAYYQMTLDLPKGQEIGWATLLEITSSRDDFNEHYTEDNETNIIQFLLADKNNPGSIVNSVLMARENTRTTRDIVTPQLWEDLNELRIFVENKAEAAIQRRRRFDFLEEVVKRCQQINGLIDSVISRTVGYRFLQLGKHIERADMATRMLDVGVTAVKMRCDNLEANIRYDTLLWMHILLSLNALTMYRHRIGPKVEGFGVVHFLLKDVSFPRSINYCVEQIGLAISKLPNHRAAIASFSRLQDDVHNADGIALSKSGLHEFMDHLQVDLNEQNKVITESWFGQG